jgi:hypothetical protein
MPYIRDAVSGRTYWAEDQEPYPRLTPKPETWITLKSPAPSIPGSFPEPTQPKPKEPSYTSRYHKAIDPMVR